MKTDNQTVLENQLEKTKYNNKRGNGGREKQCRENQIRNQSPPPSPPPRSNPYPPPLPTTPFSPHSDPKCPPHLLDIGHGYGSRLPHGISGGPPLLLVFANDGQNFSFSKWKVIGILKGIEISVNWLF